MCTPSLYRQEGHGRGHFGGKDDGGDNTLCNIHSIIYLPSVPNGETSFWPVATLKVLYLLLRGKFSRQPAL